MIFKEVTLGYPIIMGRKTYETPKTYKSKPKLLPGRLNIVITRQQDYEVPDGGIVAHSLEEALAIPEVKQSDKVFIIGGGEIFEMALALADRLYYTRVHTTIQDGDKFFKFDPNKWRLVSSKLYKKNEVPDRPYDFEFQEWVRR